MIELWKDIKGFNGKYQVSNLGRVKNSNRILIGGTFSNGYKFVCLTSSPYQSRNYLIHRLVAEAFIKNINNGSDVNHIDGNKQNNKLDNLEWCSRSENLSHAIKTGLVKNQCKIRRKVKISNDLLVKEFDSLKECSLYLNKSRGFINSRIKKYGFSFNEFGFHFEISPTRGECI